MSSDIHFVCDDDSVELCDDDRKILENLFKLSDKDDESDSLQSFSILNQLKESAKHSGNGSSCSSNDFNNNANQEVNRNIKGKLNASKIIIKKLDIETKNNK